MKKTFIKIIACSAVVLGLSSCNKFLDIKPDNIMTEESVFSKRLYTDEWLANIYSRVQDQFRDQTATEGTQLLGDELTMHSYLGQLECWPIRILPGSWSPVDFQYDLWTSTYNTVRQAYVFIDKVHAIDGNPNLSEKRAEQYRREARFLIAYHYYKMLQFYGPFPLVKSLIPSDAPTSELYLPRTPVYEIVDWLGAEFDALGESWENGGLPETYSEEDIMTDVGRPLRGAALAYAAEVRLWGASALFNHNPDYAKYKNPNGTPLFEEVGTTVKDKWLDAKAAYDRFFAYNDANNKYTLYKEYTDDGEFDPLMSLINLMLTTEEKNKEMIFFRVGPRYATSAGDGIGWYEQFHRPVGASGFSGCCGATLQSIDRFFMANGRSIDADGSGYKASGYSTEPYKLPIATDYTWGVPTKEKGVVCETGTYNRFVGREPRFYAYVTWPNRWLPVAGNGNRQRAEYWAGGHSSAVGTFDASQTGLQACKMTTLTARPNNRNTMAKRPSMLLRLGEIYLHYAEVLAELETNMTDIQKYVNLIRERAGIPQYGSADLPAPTSYTGWLEAVRKEQINEFAYEGMNYHNFRRWKIAKKEYDQPLRGFDVNKTWAQKDEFFKETTTVTVPRRWYSKFYLWPIPQGIIDKNPNLVQNPFWIDAPDI